MAIWVNVNIFRRIINLRRNYKTTGWELLWTRGFIFSRNKLNMCWRFLFWLLKSILNPFWKQAQGDVTAWSKHRFFSWNEIVAQSFKIKNTSVLLVGVLYWINLHFLLWITINYIRFIYTVHCIIIIIIIIISCMYSLKKSVLTRLKNVIMRCIFTCLQYKNNHKFT